MESKASPQKAVLAVRVHVAVTLLMFSLATRYGLQTEHEVRRGATG